MMANDLKRMICVIQFLMHYSTGQSFLNTPVVNDYISDCKACILLMESLSDGLSGTKSGGFAGGDTAWEETHLSSYNTSEVRWAEVQEFFCRNASAVHKSRCFAIAERYEGELDQWWMGIKRASSSVDEFTVSKLVEILCINTFTVCCLANRYGPSCLPCPEYSGKVCSGNGKCVGAGERIGSGQCQCNDGYVGELCNRCADTHFVSYRNEDTILCSPCFSGCKMGCNHAGASGCKECKSGWLMKHKLGCTDVNECNENRNICAERKFCINTEGSYKCLSCDKACATCKGNGPDMCIKCADDFVNVRGVCIDKSLQDREAYVNLTRYLTYLGLCLTICIIFQRNVTLAAIIGVAVAVYISVAEYNYIF